ncbi:hypothetical protein ACX818_001364 [Acinetobacter baumannii]
MTPDQLKYEEECRSLWREVYVAEVVKSNNHNAEHAANSAVCRYKAKFDEHFKRLELEHYELTNPL